MAQTPTTEADIDARIARIDALTANGRTNWFGLTAYLAFVLITVLAVDDVDFFDPSRNTALPLIGVSVPTFSFFVFAPILGAALYVYLHLTIRKATEALCAVPHRIGADALEERIKPWLLNDMVLRLRGTDDEGQRAATPRPLDLLAMLSVTALIWLAGPALLAMIWVRSWPAHNWPLSLTIAAALLVTVFAGTATWIKMDSDLGGGDEHAGGLMRDVALIFVAMGMLMTTMQQTHLGVPQADGTVRLAQADLSGARLSVLPPDQADPVAAQQHYRAEWCGRLGIARDICGSLPAPGSETEGAIWSRRLPWCQANGIAEGDPDACRDWFRAADDDFREEWDEYRGAVIAALPKPDLSGRDLRGADLSDAEVVGINLVGARLEGADLSEARMEGADLTGARMERAVMNEALLDRADLSEAWMEGADLSEARMIGANFDGASLVGANFTDAQMDGANLTDAKMEGADLRWAQMDGAVLSRAGLAGANLNEAQMAGADLRSAWMEGAKLRDAILRNADLRDTRLQQADLGYALMQGADLSGAQLHQADLRHAQSVAARFNGAHLRGAHLGGASLGQAVLVGARMDGAIFSYARMAGAIWSGASTAANPASFADFRGGVDLDQARLSSLIGNAATLLPVTPEGEPDLFIPSCWAADPPGFDHLVAGLARYDISADDLRDPDRGFFCVPGEGPRKTGTPWPVDADPPWGAQGEDESDQDYRQRMEAWAAAQPPGNPID